MRHVPFILIMLVSVLCLYTTIYSAQAIAQEKNPEEKPDPVLITLEKPSFDDLKQVDETVKAMTIIDGKTFVGYDGNTYMLASLDIQLDEGDFSIQSKQFLEELIKDQTLITFQTKDRKYGRENRMGHTIIHAVRETDSTWIQASLLANGLARVRTTEFNPQQASKMLEHEENARTKKLGIWGQDSYKVLTSQNAQEFIGGFRIVEGQIKKVASTKNNIYLNFGDNWKTDFTIGISPKVRRDLSKNNISVMDWAGKKIRIHGWIRSYNGPYIELTHAEQIEFIKDEIADEEE
ncbi:MAG: thermonuclease family protein [Bdellovibrionales bacterium]